MNHNYLVMLPNEHGTVLIKQDGSQTVSAERPKELIEKWCLENGSSMEGRETSFRYLTGCRQKAAVLISEVHNEIWFPTLSASHKECMWISYYHAVNARSLENNECRVLFDSGISYSINCSIRTFKLQMERCRQFLIQINENRL